MPRTFAASIVLAALASILAAEIVAQTEGPRILIVTAHQDDNIAFAGMTYRMTHDLGGVVDLALLTDGAGGFRYATLAEPIYGLELTDEKVGREHLPEIRTREMIAAGEILGIGEYYFLEQYDHGFTTDADTVLNAVWDTAFVRSGLTEIMTGGEYDYVVGLLPHEVMHGHHKSATILALRAVSALPAGPRPIVLGGFPCSFQGQVVGQSQMIEFSGMQTYTETEVAGGAPLARFDNSMKIGHEGRLDYSIVVNWAIAEHKSQGTMQLLVQRGGEECYWYFDANGSEGRAQVTELFERLAR